MPGSIQPAPMVDGSLCLALSGELDMAVLPHLDAEIDRALALPAVREVLIDFARVSFVDSTVLGVLVSGRQRAEQRGVTFRLTNVPPNPRKILDITGVLPYLADDA